MQLVVLLSAIAMLLETQQTGGAVPRRLNSLGLPASKIFVLNSGVQMPKVIYGTWAKPATVTDLTYDAVKLGYRGLDSSLVSTYNETGVGVALSRLYTDRVVTREQLFIQTKFSPNRRNLVNKYYDPNATMPNRVKQSLQASLRLLNTTYLDSLVLHWPLPTHAETMEVWRTFESFVDAGSVFQIGLSNFYNRSEFERIYSEARIKPSVVQNRFSVATGMDRDLRAFLREKQIGYQIYSALKHNSSVIVDSDVIAAMATKYNKTNAQVFVRFMIQSDITPLMGAANKKHIREDFETLDMQLTDSEVQAIDKLFP